MRTQLRFNPTLTVGVMTLATVLSATTVAVPAFAADLLTTDGRHYDNVSEIQSEDECDDSCGGTECNVAMAAPAFAATFLTGDEVRKIVSGNTVYFEVPGKGDFKAYLDSNGEVTRVHEKKILEGTWRVKDDGALCVHYASVDERCGTVKTNMDGTYTRVDDANVNNHWKKVVTGKDL
jgi:hypothetical protein